MFRLAAKAIAFGKVVSPLRAEWDISGNCQFPVGRDFSYRRHRPGYLVTTSSRWGIGGRRRHKEGFIPRYRQDRLPLGYTVGLTMRCRKCEKCRRMRQNLWSHRAQYETMIAPRTWFGTLTLRPECQFYYHSRARLSYARRQRGDLDLESVATQFTSRINAISPEVTKYLKRIRKNSGAPIRYLVVCEAHKSGDPHFHLLVHEKNRELMVTHKELTRQWGLGFSKWKLVDDPKRASYLTKYLSKSSAARVRASLNYGQDVLEPNRTPFDSVIPVYNDDPRRLPQLKEIVTVQKEAENGISS